MDNNYNNYNNNNNNNNNNNINDMVIVIIYNMIPLQLLKGQNIKALIHCLRISILYTWSRIILYTLTDMWYFAETVSSCLPLSSFHPRQPCHIVTMDSFIYSFVSIYQAFFSYMTGIDSYILRHACRHMLYFSYLWLCCHGLNYLYCCVCRHKKKNVVYVGTHCTK